MGRGSITVADLGSTNGSRLDDLALDGHPRTWPTGAVLRLGASAVTVAGPGAATAAVEAAPAGRMRVRPLPRMTAPLAETEVVFPRPPAEPPRRRLAWVAVALPAVGGLLMAWLLHTPTFLFFALLSPVVALGTWLSERWSGRRSGRRGCRGARTGGAGGGDGPRRGRGRRRPGARRPRTRISPRSSPPPGGARTCCGAGGEDADALTVRVGCGPGPTG